MKITLIGSGKIGTALAVALRKKGHVINEICGRNKKTTTALAKKVNAKTVLNVKNISPESDLYIICVNDQYIPEVIEDFPFRNKPVLHTSGATPSNVLKKFLHHGVLYPVNSVSHSIFSFKDTPFCITSNSVHCLKIIKSLVKDLQGKVMPITDKQRLAVHLSAVFVNNFSNALYQSAYEILHHEKIPFDILLPLIEETNSKIMGQVPAKVQTGPAVRNDMITMEKHLQLLKNQTGLKKIYQLLSALIVKQQKSIR